MSMLVSTVVTLFGLVGSYQLLTDALKIEAGCLSETLVSTYKSVCRYNPEHQH
jgi:hypothetical protein